MKTYWDYEEKERAEMTEGQVSALLDAELMTKGVLKVVAPVLKIVQAVNLPTRSYCSVDDIVFDTLEQAKAFLELNPMKKSYNYAAGYRNEFPKKMDPEIRAVVLTDEQSVLNALTILAQNKAATEHNEKAEAAFTKASEGMERILRNVWDDWHSCRSLAADHQKVIDTFKEYTKMAEGNEALAEDFLLKVYTAEQIQAAKKWFGIEKETAPAPVEA